MILEVGEVGKCGPTTGCTAIDQAAGFVRGTNERVGMDARVEG